MKSEKMMISLNGLAYASFMVVKEYEKINNESPSGLYFNKAISFLNTILKNKGIDLAVPHCWYRWGDEVVRYYMPRDLKWTHEENVHTIVDWEGGIPDYPEGNVKELIDYNVREMTKKYAIKGQIQDFVDTIYEEAPFEFQRKYKQVRDFFYTTSNSGIMDEKEKRKLLIRALEEALKSFPSDDIFDDVRELIPKFKRLMDYGLNSSSIDLKILNEVSEEFWFLFCYYLRIHPKSYENVRRDTIRYWTEILPDKKSEFMENFRDHVLGFSHIIHKISTDDEIGSCASQALRDDEEFNQLFSEFQSSVDELDEFLAENKKKYRFGGLN